MGGDPDNPLDILIHVPAPRVAVSATSGTWSHDGGPDGFLVESIVHDGPHPVTPIPEPATVLLLATGLAELAWQRRG